MAVTTPHRIDLAATPWGTDRGPSWQLWDHGYWPDELEFQLALLVPEHPDALQTITGIVPALREEVSRHGARNGVEAFLAASAQLDQLLDRRAAVGLLARLSAFPRPPQLPHRPRTARPDRPRLLRPLEVAQLRAAADTPPRAVLCRLLAAGVTVSEAARVRTADVTIAEDRQVIVGLPGSRGRRPRTLALTPGVSRAVETLLRSSPDGYLLPTDRLDTAHHRHRAADKIATNLLHTIGLSTDPAVTPASIRATGLRAIHDQFGPAAAAISDGATDPRNLTRQLHL